MRIACPRKYVHCIGKFLTGDIWNVWEEILTSTDKLGCLQLNGYRLF